MKGGRDMKKIYKFEEQKEKYVIMNDKDEVFIINKDNLKILEDWLKSYHPEELFDENGTLIKELKDLAPTGIRRMGANPHANGGLLLKELNLPDFREYGVNITEHGKVQAQDMIELGKYIKDIIREEAEEVVVLLGVRKAESIARKRRIEGMFSRICPI